MHRLNFKFPEMVLTLVLSFAISHRPKYRVMSIFCPSLEAEGKTSHRLTYAHSWNMRLTREQMPK